MSLLYKILHKCLSAFIAVSLFILKIFPHSSQIMFLRLALRIFWWWRLFLMRLIPIVYSNRVIKHNTQWGTTRFFLEHVPEGSRVLDVGCSSGFLTKQIACQAREVIAFDVSEESIITAKRENHRNNLKYFVGNTERDIPKEKFDVVILSSVLTFVKEPNQFLKGLLEITSTILVRETRYDDSYLVLLSRDLGIEKHPWKEFTWSELKQLLESSGWKIEEVWQSFDMFIKCTRL